MKAFLVIIAFSFQAISVFSQLGINTPWVWMKGNKTAYVFEPMPAQGVPSATARPDPRDYATSVTDKTGKLWLFGGASDIASPHLLMYDDLWSFDPQTNNWTFLKGNGGYVTPIPIQPVYGTLGVPDPANRPGFRTNVVSWADDSGNLWIFGGYGYGGNGSYGPLNDLWRYTIATNTWTWMKGSMQARNLGSYGIAGVASPNNFPPSRYGAVTWETGDGLLWLFGGTDEDAFFNDIWKYDISTNIWTWMKGTRNLSSGGHGNYGTQGVSDPANMPPGRYYASSWVQNNGNLWLFGGHTSFAFPEYKNDLWKYSPSLNEWTWVKGSNDLGGAAVFGAQGVASDLNCPAGKFSALSFTDLSGNFWLMGGYNAGTSSYFSNDLWKFNPATSQWTWMKGSSTSASGNYGTLGVPSATNRPGSRAAACTWTDPLGGFWVYGGYGYDENGDVGDLSDMWTINSLNLLPARETTLRGRNETQKNILEWTVNDIADITEFILERSADGNSFEPVKTISPLPASLKYGYPDVPAIKQRYYYRIKTNYSGAFRYSNTISLTPLRQPLEVFPNPANALLNLKIHPGDQPSAFTVYNAAGMEVMKKNTVAVSALVTLDVSALPAGFYRVKLSCRDNDQWASFLK